MQYRQTQDHGHDTNMDNVENIGLQKSRVEHIAEEDPKYSYMTIDYLIWVNWRSENGRA